MRLLIALLLSLFLTLNGASAAIHGVFDAFEGSAEHPQATQHGKHSGHHEHELTDVPDVKVLSDKSDNSAGDDSASFNQTHPDHYHTHPPFITLIPDFPGVPALPESNALSTLPVAVLVSVIPLRLERPPRAVLA